MSPEESPRLESVEALAGFLSALARDGILTLGEVQAAMPMIDQASGAIVPAKLADRGDQGWGDDGDRDSGAAQELASLVKKLDELTAEWVNGSGPWSQAYPDQSEFVNLINGLTRTWSAIRKITRDNGGS